MIHIVSTMLSIFILFSAYGQSNNDVQVKSHNWSIHTKYQIDSNSYHDSEVDTIGFTISLNDNFTITFKQDDGSSKSVPFDKFEVEITREGLVYHTQGYGDIIYIPEKKKVIRRFPMAPTGYKLEFYN